MARHKEPRKRFAPLAVLLGVFAMLLATLSIAAPAEATGNQGTIKVHALGSEPGTESNEPKVCAFNLEFYTFVQGFDGYVEYDVQGGDGPTGIFAGPFAVGTANADGYFVSQYFNVEGGPTIQNGHYKVTLYGKFNDGRINYEDIKAKSKVFKVDCPATPPPPPPPAPKDCPEGTFLISQFKWDLTNQTYVAEGSANGVTLTGNDREGSFTSTSTVSGFVLTGTSDVVVVVLGSPVTSGIISRDDLPTVNGQSQSIVSVKFCGTEGPPPPPPAPEGSNNSSTPGCKQITVGQPTGVKPEGATPVVKLDGVVTQPGTYATTPGTHVVTTFVNGTLVDTDTVVVEDCPVTPPPPPPVVVPPVVTPPPPPVVNPPVVVTPPVVVIPPSPAPKFVKGNVKKLDKCESNNSYKAVRVKGAHYTVNGKTIREGVYLKAKTRVVKIKLVADSARYAVTGRDLFVIGFPNKEDCSPVVVVTPPAGG